MGRLTALVARYRGADKLSKPRVIYVNDEFLQVTPGKRTDGLTVIRERNRNALDRTFKVYEQAEEIEAARNPSTTDIYVKGKIGAGLSSLGANQGAALALTKYLNDVTGGTTGTADGVKLPAAVVGAVCVIVNSVAFTLKVYPATGEFIDALAVNINDTILAGVRASFVCDVTGKWIRAVDYGQ